MQVAVFTLRIMKKIALLSDTHGYIDDRWQELFAQCDEIWHAGDIGTAQVTNHLKSIKPLRAVYGNIDGAALRTEFPEFQFFESEGVKVLMIHIAGGVGKYNATVKKLAAQHGKPDLLICGHSHILKVQMDPAFYWLYMNPGAAGVHGFHKMRTCLRFGLADGRIHDLEVIELGSRNLILKNK